MKRTDLTIFLVLAVIGLIAGFYLLVIGPKRDEASSLQGDIDQLRSSLEQEEQAAAAGEQARRHFGVNYHSLVVLGKAVPEDSDTPSLLVQLQDLADRADVEFKAIDLSESSGGEAPTAPSTTSTETSSSSSSASTTVPAGEGATSSAPATETAAASLPLGATIGPAGLPVMPYDLKFTGGFFEIADFLENLDRMVHSGRGRMAVDGRLLTVDGFALDPIGEETNPTPTLVATLSVTTYLTPPHQGITAGASPGGPAPATPAPVTPTPASSTSSTTDPIPDSAPATP
jgi:Tfp pilus assembly protein PilO